MNMHAFESVSVRMMASVSVVRWGRVIDRRGLLKGDASESNR
jgi:hypothetical protein